MIEKLTKNTETGLAGVTEGEEGFVDEDGVWWSSRKAYLQSEILGLCDCGNPDEVMGYVYQGLLNLKNNIHGAYEDLPHMFWIYWANDRDFAEHGCSARCSWLTAKGKELMRDIETLMSEEEQ